MTDLGTAGVLALGDHNVLADGMQAFHWDVTYGKSPYLRSSQEELLHNWIAKGQGDLLHSLTWNDEAGDIQDSCFKSTSTGAGKKLLFESIATRWGFRDDKLKLKTSRIGSRRFGRSARFTFVISANVGGLVELRFARMEADNMGSLGTQWMDLHAKHAFLNRGQDYVLWAGEAWVQLSSKAFEVCDVKGQDSDSLVQCLNKLVKDGSLQYATIVINNDSGTFKAGASVDVRKKVRAILGAALGGTDRLNVCSIPDLIKDPPGAKYYAVHDLPREMRKYHEKEGIYHYLWQTVELLLPGIKEDSVEEFDSLHEAKEYFMREMVIKGKAVFAPKIFEGFMPNSEDVLSETNKDAPCPDHRVIYNYDMLATMRS